MQQRAAADFGRHTTSAQLERQPDECGKKFGVIPASQLAGVEARSIIKRYESMILGPINDRITGCYEFNEEHRQLIANPQPPAPSLQRTGAP